MTTNLEIANTILDQLGGGRFAAMIGISVYYLPPRARQPRPRQVIYWNFTQGDFGAEATKETPIQMLAARGVDAYYNCGRLD